MISIVPIVFILKFYDRIPKQFPLKYCFTGEVTVLSYGSPHAGNASIHDWTVNTMIARSKQQISVEKPEDLRKQQIVFGRRWSAFIVITGTARTLLFAFIQCSTTSESL